MPANSQSREQQTREAEGSTIGTRVPFEGISEPGAYICEWSGHLLRVPPDAVAPGRSPLLNIIGSDPLYCIRISSDPFVPLTKAKLSASNLDVAVNF